MGWACIFRARALEFAKIAHAFLRVDGITGFIFDEWVRVLATVLRRIQVAMRHLSSVAS